MESVDAADRAWPRHANRGPAAPDTTAKREGGAQMEAVSMNLGRLAIISHMSEVPESTATCETDCCHSEPRAASSRQTVPRRRRGGLGAETVRGQSTVHTHTHTYRARRCPTAAAMLDEIISSSSIRKHCFLGCRSFH